MNINKQTVVLAAAAAVLAIPTVLTLRGETELFVDIAKVPRMFDGFSQDSVAHLLLLTPKPAAATPPAVPDPKKPAVEHDGVQISRTDKGWVFAQLPADLAPKLTGAPVSKDLLDNQVWKHLGEIRIDKETIVQPDATDEQLAKYGLDAPKAFEIRVLNATQSVLVDLLVGNDASGGKYDTGSVRGVFVRRADSRDVVLYEPAPQLGTLARSVKADTWVDRILFKAPADKIKKLTLKNPASNGVALEFTRGEGKGVWVATNPPEGFGAVRQQELETLSQRFATVYVTEFKQPLTGAPLKQWGLEPPQIEVGITWMDGNEEKTAQLGIGQKVDGKNDNYLRCSTSTFVSTWGTHFVAPFEKAPADLFDPKSIEPAPVDPNKDAPKKDEPKKEEAKKL